MSETEERTLVELLSEYLCLKYGLPASDEKHARGDCEDCNIISAVRQQFQQAVSQAEARTLAAVIEECCKVVWSEKEHARNCIPADWTDYLKGVDAACDEAEKAIRALVPTDGSASLTSSDALRKLLRRVAERVQLHYGGPSEERKRELDRIVEEALKSTASEMPQRKV